MQESDFEILRKSSKNLSVSKWLKSSCLLFITNWRWPDVEDVSRYPEKYVVSFTWNWLKGGTGRRSGLDLFCSAKMGKYRKISQVARRINNPWTAAYNMDTMTKLITPRRMTTLFEEYRVVSIKLAFVWICSLFGLTVTKEKVFFMCFSWQPWLPFIPLVYYTTNKRLGGVSTSSPPRLAFIRGPALNRENTVSALRIYFISR